MNIYEQLNKINDKESLSEKYNVKNAKELKKLIESVDSESNSTDYTDIRKNLISHKISDVTDYEGEYTDAIYMLYADVTEELMDEYEDLFIEPSVQAGRGGVFAWFTRNGEEYEAVWDYEDECRLINKLVVTNDTPEKFKAALKSAVRRLLDKATLKESLSESSDGKQDVRHEAQRIHDELIEKGYTDEEIDSIIRILHTASLNNFEPARPKLKAAFPDLDI